MPSQPLNLPDFSGGIQESRAPEEFDAGQWATLKGFVLESETTIRTQWACQRVSADTGFQAVHGMLASGGAYLVGVRTNGTICWAKAPSRNADFATTRALTWQPLTGTNPDFRILCEVPLPQTSAGRYNGLLLHSQSGTAAAVVVYEDIDGHLGVKSYTDFYPAAPLNDKKVPIPASGKMPRANVGTMWADRLILGDISYLEDPKAKTLSSATVTRYPSSVWYSEGRIDTYDPLSVLNMGSAETQIVGLHTLDNALVIITSASTERDGVITLRGDLSSLGTSATSDTDNLNPNIVKKVLRGGVGGVPRPNGGTGHYGFSCMWSEVGVVVFIDRLGGIWHTEGTELMRLDYFGPAKPPVAVVGDHVAAVGSYLFAARAGRLLAFRYLSKTAEAGQTMGTGSWTELVTPVPGQVRSMAPLEDCLYFVGSDGSCWRYALGVAPERGLVNGAPVTLTVETPTMAAPGEHEKALWFRFGMTLGDVRDGRVLSATVRSGPALSDGSPVAPGVTTQLDRALEDRATFIVPAAGSSAEASASVYLSGDVTLEAATFWTSGVKEKR